MKSFVVAVFLVIASNAYSEAGWKETTRTTDPSVNLAFAVDTASIETIAPNVSRALVKSFRPNPKLNAFGDYDVSYGHVEIVIDFDCKKSRYKILKAYNFNLQGQKVSEELADAPVFSESSPGSMMEITRNAVCFTLK